MNTLDNLRKEFVKDFIQSGSVRVPYNFIFQVRFGEMWSFISKTYTQGREEGIEDNEIDIQERMEDVYKQGGEDKEKEIIKEAKKLLKGIVWESEWQKVKKFLDLLTHHKGGGGNEKK